MHSSFAYISAGYGLHADNTNFEKEFNIQNDLKDLETEFSSN